MQTIELNVSGMNCGACATHVAQGLRGVAGVQDVQVDLKTAKATVQGEGLTVDQLVAAVEEEGYGATPVAGAV